MPKDWKDNPLASGVISWNAVTPSTTPVAPVDMNLYFPIMFTFYMTWLGADGSKPAIPFSSFRAISGKDYGEVPYVFGKKSVRYKIGRPDLPTLAAIPIPDFEIELPGIGFSAPKLKTVQLRVGEVELTFTPIKWIGPSFTTDYKVTAEGLKPGQHLFLTGGLDGSSMLNSDYDPIMLRVSAGQASHVGLGREKLVCTAFIVEEEQGEVRVVAGPGSSSGFTQVHYKDKMGRLLATGYDFSGTPVSSGSAGAIQPNLTRTDQSAPIGFKIDGRWVGYSFEANAGSVVELSRGMSLKPHSKGTYKALLFNPVKKVNVNQAGFRIPQKDLEALAIKSRR